MSESTTIEINKSVHNELKLFSNDHNIPMCILNNMVVVAGLELIKRTKPITINDKLNNDGFIKF